jgi:hypothetical protein
MVTRRFAGNCVASAIGSLREVDCYMAQTVWVMAKLAGASQNASSRIKSFDVVSVPVQSFRVPSWKPGRPSIHERPEVKILPTSQKNVSDLTTIVARSRNANYFQ